MDIVLENGSVSGFHREWTISTVMTFRPCHLILFPLKNLIGWMDEETTTLGLYSVSTENRFVYKKRELPFLDRIM